MNIKRPSRKTLMQFTLVILAIFIIRAWQQQDLSVGRVPSFTSQTLSGQVVNSNPLPDQAMLIHFWATWCDICRLENDNIQALEIIGTLVSYSPVKKPKIVPRTLIRFLYYPMVIG